MGKRTIKNNIRTLRFFRQEMTQEQLAELVGVTRQTIIAMEKGKYSPSLELAFRVALAFEVPLEQVFTYEESDEPPP
jgi:putative transcriptional regulator